MVILRGRTWSRAAALLAASTLAASAADLTEMVGTWRWKDFTIEVSECGERLCARIIAGPKNIGMEIIASTLVARDGQWFGQIIDPETKETYNTRFLQTDKDRWRLDGCTAAKVCLTAEFVRAK
jgi:uncharacterized protein (DUF2147 family)